MGDYSVGLGFDVHRFSKVKRTLLLCGVKIPCSFGLEAVSDGDVALHAISDALCGACSLGDIGDFFPCDDPGSKNISSITIVRSIIEKVQKRFTVLTLDVTLVSEKPKLSGHKSAMLASLKKIFPRVALNIKIKSKEGLDILGGRKAISCFALATVKSKQ